MHWRAEVTRESAKYALYLAPRTWFPDMKLLQFVFCISVDVHTVRMRPRCGGAKRNDYLLLHVRAHEDSPVLRRRHTCGGNRATLGMRARTYSVVWSVSVG